MGLRRDNAKTEARERHHKVTCFRFVDPPIRAISCELTRAGMLRSVLLLVTLIGVFKQIKIDNFTQSGLCAISGDRWHKCLQLATTDRHSESQTIAACYEIVTQICKQRGFDLATSGYCRNCKQLPRVLKLLF